VAAGRRSVYQDQADYLGRSQSRRGELVAQGWFLAEDTAEQLADARHAEIF
jgi:hypothetical protein